MAVWNRRLVLSLLAAAACGLAADLPLADAGQAKPPQEPEPITMPLELLANRPLVRVTVNGQGPFAFLVSPEHNRVSIDRELAELLKVRPQSSSADAAPTVDLGLGPKYTAKVTVAIQDNASFVPELGAAMRPRGVLGLSAWKEHLVTLDYTRWRVTFEPGALPDPNGKDVFPLNAAGEFRMPLTMAEQTIDCHIDPLFPGVLMLPPTAASQPMAGDPRDGGTLQTKNGPMRVREARLANNATLGPFQLKSPHVLLALAGDSATVGTPWLWRYAVTYDAANRRVRLEAPAPQLTR